MLSKFLDMTYYHHRNVRMFTGLLLSDWLVRTREPLDSAEHLRIMRERIKTVDDIYYGLPWRLNYRKINEQSEPVQSNDAPPIMWSVSFVDLLIAELTRAGASPRCGR